MRSPAVLRVLALVAAAFLGFDGAALAAFGFWFRHPVVALIGLCLFVSSGLVLLSLRRQARRLEEIAAARRELRDEVEALRRLLRG